MKKSNLRKYFLAAFTAILPLPAFAQAAPVTIVENMHPHLVLAIVAGVILAFAFQLALMGLSLATGLSLTPNLMKASAKAKAARLAGNTATHFDEEEHEKKLHMHESVHLVNSLGVATLVTISISLFLATWLSLRLSFINGDEYRYVMATVVWAAFLMILTYLEWKSVRSMLGGLASIASSGFHTGTGFLHGLISKSPAHQLEDAAKHTMHSVFKDLSHAARKSDLPKTLGRYLQDVKPDGLDYDRIHDEIADLVSKTKDLSDTSEDKVMKLLKKKLDDRHPLLTPANAVLLGTTINQALKSAKEANRTSDGLFGAVESFVPLPEGKARELREKFEAFLAGTNRDELNPESIRADIEKIVAEPGAAIGLIKSRLSHFDRETVKSLIAQNSNLDADKANKVVESVLGAVDKLKGQYGSTTGAANEKMQAMQGTVEEKLHGYLDAMHLPEINATTIKAEVEHILHSLSDAPHILRERAEGLNKEKILEMLKSNRFVSPQQIDTILAQVTDARDDFARHVKEIEDKAISTYENIRRKAVITAEHARKASIAASWWLFGTAIVSLIAALIGAYYSKMTITF